MKHQPPPAAEPARRAPAIRTVLEEQKLEALLQKIAGATGLAVALADYRGDECAHINCCAFCRMMREGSHPICTAANATNAFGITQACVTEQPCLFFCPYGLLMMAVPIIVEGQYLGGFIAGQVRCTDAPAATVHLKTILPYERGFLRRRAIRQAFDAIPVVPYQKFADTADLIALLLCGAGEGAADRALRRSPAPARRGTDGLRAAALAQLLDLIHQGQYSALLRAIPALVQHLLAQERETAPEALCLPLAQAMAPGEDLAAAAAAALPPRLGGSDALAPSADYWIFFLSVAADRALRARFLHRHSQFAPLFALIDSRLQSDLPLAELCQSCRFSQSYMSRLFRAQFHVSVTEYLHWRRIALGRLYLAFPAGSITEIGCLLGYSDGSYFSKVFKKYTGLSPRQYQRLTNHL